MSWETFYFFCFCVGFLCSLVSFLAGTTHLHLHLPRGLHGRAHPGAGGRGSQASPINFGTVAAFLAWFGGTGYLLSRYSSIWALLALGLAIVSGLAGAAAVFWFLFKVLLKHERDLDPADYEMVGVLGRLSSTVRENGIGEMIFSQDGARRAASVRSEDGRPIAKGVEVVVTRYERGIAYVRTWDEISESKKES
ncbi:MAG TPA: NfeD family protein [Bryobacteraceae bacterium]|jgi:membrane protein implicated in regulation of membrane protease activity|nr:NfeD family protein [Bryobacteraceae bacterium]